MRGTGDEARFGVIPLDGVSVAQLRPSGSPGGRQWVVGARLVSASVLHAALIGSYRREQTHHSGQSQLHQSFHKLIQYSVGK